ncbi:ABC transporter substrate-binding protein [Rhizobium sp. 2MFCol3.1]|uniref:ABC transporter substrate-binding protein n=1 Tax=Rhizobium sp. 2MFCol3.1 TaxID=1246459 RepID=UPI000367465B|nr:ABC transporter substrate-binding protein [Rhizobium sp. 2MFCol3.1]
MHIARPVSRLLRAAALASAFFTLALPLRAAEVTDVLSRKVNVPDHVQRVVLGEGRLFYAMALLDHNAPFGRIVGWQNDLRKLDEKTFEGYLQKYPQAKDIPLIGETSEASVSVEKILSLKPDLAVFSIAGHGPGEHSPIADVLAKAGIPVIFVDFRVHPIAGTRTSIQALGTALGREKEATAFLDFYNAHLARISDAVKDLPPEGRPKVFLELLAGIWKTPGHTTGNGGLGEMITAAGGRNIAEGVVPGAIGDISVEYALQSDPDIYVATGNRAPGVQLGAQIDRPLAEKTMTDLMTRPEFSSLRAIREGRSHGLWHEFYNTPYNILAIEALAKWTHPDLFKDLDPEATKHELYKSFLPLDETGTYWIDTAAKR